MKPSNSTSFGASPAGNPSASFAGPGTGTVKTSLPVLRPGPRRKSQRLIRRPRHRNRENRRPLGGLGRSAPESGSRRPALAQAFRDVFLQRNIPEPIAPVLAVLIAKRPLELFLDG